MKRVSSLAVGIAAAASLLLVACGKEPAKNTGGASSYSDMEALVAAAKAEQQLVFYSSQAESINNAWAEAFQAKYGITVLTTRMQGAEVGTRYQAEASAGKVLADVIMPACTEAKLFSSLAEQGLTTSASKLGLPALATDAGKANLRANGDAFMSAILPVVIGYNTQKISKADLPADWDDLLDPKYKGKIVMTNPTASTVYPLFLKWLTDQYGEDMLRKLGQQDLQYADAATGRNQLSAGQAVLNIPTFGAPMEDSIKSGAPVAYYTPESTTAVEICIGISSDTRAPHPNAARLFAHFVTSAEGAAVLDNLKGVASPFGKDGAPKAVKPLPLEVDPARVMELLGFKK